ncbi:MAG: class I SAM-dependent methyltransferase, partial [Candidatus Omnitrophica bacterium]|nr:class I SAM-dependent methyltransferase [Candidatus Omnitrophota bacterium]
MIRKLYYWFHAMTSRPSERGEYSSGRWQDTVRRQAVAWAPGSPGGRLLEIGCGEGLLLAQLAKERPGLSLSGIDNSRERIQRATSRLAGRAVHLAVEDATRLSFADESFDCCVCINVFFNMPSIEVVRAALAEMKRVSKRNGTFIFDFRNAANPLLVLKYALAPWYDATVKGLPLKTYRLSHMQRLLVELGLQIIETKQVGAKAGFPAPIIMVKARK